MSEMRFCPKCSRQRRIGRFRRRGVVEDAERDLWCRRCERLHWDEYVGTVARPGSGSRTYLRATLIRVKQNLTLALPVETVRRLKVVAAERGSSISRMLTEQVEAILRRDDEYEEARKRALARLEHGYDLGTGGNITWTRDELHQR